MNIRVKSRLTSVIGASIIFFGLTTSAMAISLGFGFSGGGTNAKVDGTEVMKQSGDKSTAAEEARGALGTVYAQIIVGESYFGEGNGFALGYDHFFGAASISTKKRSDNDQTKERTLGYAVTQYAKASVKNLNTIFIETPGFTRLGIYLKAGYSGMDVITQEALATGGSYGDISLDGTTYGFGFKKSAGGFQVKTEFNHTDWDDFRLSNTNTATGLAGADYIDADIENWAFKFTVGYNF